jgi:hypothetical protein
MTIEDLLERIKATLACETSALVVYIGIMSNLHIYDKLKQIK